MDLKPTIDLCEKLLSIYTDHQVPNCTDSNKANRFSTPDGYVVCIRCWLLTVLEKKEIPENIELNILTLIKTPKKETSVSLKEFSDLLSTGTNHPAVINFLEINKNNSELIDLARIIFCLKNKLP